MKILLLETVRKIGKKGDIVEIPNGYAQNYIIPHKLGIRASEETIHSLQKQETQRREQKEHKLETLEQSLRALSDKEIVIIKKVDSSGSLFAAIQKEDIQRAIYEAEKIRIPVEVIYIEAPIKHTGTFQVLLTSKEKQSKYSVSLIVKGQ